MSNDEMFAGVFGDSKTTSADDTMPPPFLFAENNRPRAAQTMQSPPDPMMLLEASINLMKAQESDLEQQLLQKRMEIAELIDRVKGLVGRIEAPPTEPAEAQFNAVVERAWRKPSVKPATTKPDQIIGYLASKRGKWVTRKDIVLAVGRPCNLSRMVRQGKVSCKKDKGVTLYRIVGGER